MSRFRPRHLFTRLVLPFVLLAGFLSVAGTFLVVRQSYQTLRDRQVARSAEATTRVQFALAKAEERTLDDAARLAADDRLVALGADPAGLTGLLRTDQAVDPAPSGVLAVIDLAGRDDTVQILAAAGPGGALMPAEQQRLQASLVTSAAVRAVRVGATDATGDKWSGLVSGPGGMTRLVVVAPVRGTTRAVVALADVQATVADLARTAGLDFAVLTPEGTALASTFPDQVAGAFVLPAPTLALARAGTPAVSRTRWTGGDYTVAVAPLQIRGAFGGYVAAAAADAPVMQSVAASRTQIVVALAGGLFMVALIGLVLSRRIARSVEALSAAAQQVADGDFSARVDIRSHDELGRLADGFNTMAERLAAYADEQAEVIARLQAVDRAKDELIANASHELRTPLTPIKGAAAALRRRDLDASTRAQLADLVAANGDRMLALVNRMIAATSAAAGQGPAPCARVDVVAAVRAACAQVPIAARARVRVDAADVVADAVGDDAAVVQIVFELLDNAAKFGDSEIDVAVHSTVDEVVVTVCDRGIGVPAESRSKVFDRFFQVDASSTRRHGGLGLGLAVARDLASWMGGRLVLDAADGGGTRVTFVLPVVADAAPASAPEPALAAVPVTVRD